MLSNPHIIKLKEVINSSAKILITTHVNSDGDAIGSSLALALILKKAGKEVMILTPNDFPEFLRWLPGQELIAIYYSEAKRIKEYAKNTDLIFAVDYNDPKRLKDAENILTESKAFKVLIDHHPLPISFADLSLSFPELGSAAELIIHILKDIGFTHFIDKDIATCLFTGIMTDTGCFSYNSSYPEVFTSAAELIGYGINKDLIFSKVYDNFSVDRMRLMGYCLNEKMQILPEYNTAFISLTSEELKRFNHSPGDTEGFVNLPFSIKGIIFSALFLEKKDHVKISFRSRGNFPANEFSALHFNGGGHLNAAGGELKDSLDSAIKKFTDSLELFKEMLQ